MTNEDRIAWRAYAAAAMINPQYPGDEDFCKAADAMLKLEKARFHDPAPGGWNAEDVVRLVKIARPFLPFGHLEVDNALKPFEGIK